MAIVCKYDITIMLRFEMPPDDLLLSMLYISASCNHCNLCISVVNSVFDSLESSGSDEVHAACSSEASLALLILAAGI